MERAARKKIIISAIASVVGLAGLSGSVYAGLKTEENVSITVNGTQSTAVGAIGTARNSADATQFIRCTVQGFTSSNSVFCAARTVGGTNFSCTANGSTTLATSVSAMDSGSRLFIFAVNGVCQQIDVTNSSEHKPKVP